MNCNIARVTEDFEKIRLFSDNEFCASTLVFSQRFVLLLFKISFFHTPIITSSPLVLRLRNDVFSKIYQKCGFYKVLMIKDSGSIYGALYEYIEQFK
jgi:hypothetical protein